MTLKTAKSYVDKTDNTIVGVDKFHFSVLLNDYPDLLQYGDIYDYPGTIEISATPENVSETLYADNSAVIVYTATSAFDVSLERTNLSDEILAILLGSEVEGAVRHVNSVAKPPYVGIAWRQTYSDGSYGYIKLLKGKFQEPESVSRTREDGVDFQTRTIEGKFTETRFEYEPVGGNKFPLMMMSVMENDEQYDNEGDTWFDEIFPTQVSEWVTGTNYARGNHVINENEIYRAIVGHTSGTTFDSDTANWIKLD